MPEPSQSVASTTAGHIVWIGGPITLGRDASSAGARMTALASGDLGLGMHVYATDTATIADGIATLTDGAIADTGYPHAQVTHVVVCGGLQDQITNLAKIIATMRSVLAKLAQAYPNARIIVGACPGSIASMGDEQLARSTTILHAILGEARTAGALDLNLRQVCGADTAMQSTGIYPNDMGHEALAQAIVDAIGEDRGEPEDTPIIPQRVYTSALTDWASRQVDATRRREAEKREANRPTGTELGGVTERLDQLTQAQGVQQELLEQAQDALEQQQHELEMQQDELDRHQAQLEQQQTVLQSQQTALEGVVGNQGSTLNVLQTMTEQLDAQQQEISRQAQQLIDMENYRTGALLETLADFESRISALENK
ncbi:SGNH/GDSL hydrolase family protein [Bifidobacterium animalis]|uniref:SGNH/GDSL hydrolase family protein n=1 Tax=Bifidobacterium animalis TaxID=28025 RepID=UPI001C3EF65B|nr:SGNH/GDSL hydrolase family protein [Bifidobacterium animalis]MCR1995737.1 hypothetical protein [Bifidobacterium animalis subsp. animalis]